MATLADIIDAFNQYFGNPKTDILIIPQAFNIAVSHTALTSQAAGNANPLFIYKVPSGSGARLYAFAVAMDSATQQNFQFRMSIKSGTSERIVGQNGGPIGYQAYPTAGGYNPIPEGDWIYVSSGTTLAFYGYYSGSSGTDGTVNVSLLLKVTQ